MFTTLRKIIRLNKSKLFSTEVKKKSWLPEKKILEFCLAVVGIETCCEMLFFYNVPYPIYQNIVRIVQNDKEVKKELGFDVQKTGFSVDFEKFQISGSPEVKFNFNVEGKKGKGKVSVVVKKPRGRWYPEQIKVECPSRHLDLEIPRSRNSKINF